VSHSYALNCTSHALLAPEHKRSEQSGLKGHVLRGLQGPYDGQCRLFALRIKAISATTALSDATVKAENCCTSNR
jgi:hypothetical protein